MTSKVQPAKIYTFMIPAGGAFPLQVAGSMFKVLSSTGSFEVRADTWGTLGSILAGQGLKNAPFNLLFFIDKTGADNTLSVLISGSDFIDDRITGEVTVIDGELARSVAGIAFIASAAQAPVAAQFSMIQLWNPAGSGKRLIVSELGFSTSANSAFELRRHNAKFAAGVAFSPHSKLVNGASLSVGQGTVTTAAAHSGTLIETFDVGAYSPLQRKLSQPFVLLPGSGLSMDNNIVATSAVASFQFHEEAIP